VAGSYRKLNGNCCCCYCCCRLSSIAFFSPLKLTIGLSAYKRIILSTKLPIWFCRFTGKASPVHFFWGTFDLAVTRFSRRPALSHLGVPNCARFVMVEAYSHEVSSCGFWRSGGPAREPVFYAYASPKPRRFKEYPIEPTKGVLPYADKRCHAALRCGPYREVTR
jgi:hypothetical protein